MKPQPPLQWLGMVAPPSDHLGVADYPPPTSFQKKKIVFFCFL
jgi:hypothetical protein